MDRVSIVGDAIDYIKELQEQEKRLKDEMTALETHCEKNKSQYRGPMMKEQGETKRILSSSDFTKRTQIEVIKGVLIELCFTVYVSNPCMKQYIVLTCF